MADKDLHPADVQAALDYFVDFAHVSILQWAGADSIDYSLNELREFTRTLESALGLTTNVELGDRDA